MESRSRASQEQFLALLEFMESHGDIARPQQGAQGRIRADRLWQELGELLNSIGGGVNKSMEKWKKVWADWKAKTKKKALAMRREASGTGGGPSSRQTLTASEQRVLGIMGLSAVVGLVGIEERGFDEPPPQISSVPSPSRDTVHTEFPSQTATEKIVLYSIEASSAPPAAVPSPSELPHLPPTRVSTPPTPPLASSSTPMPSATSRNTTIRGEPQRRRRPATPSPVASPTTSTPRRQRLLRARTRRVQTPFERATSEFVAVENRRLQLEEDRERNNHQREMERLRLESRRIEMEENRNLMFNRLTGILDSLTEILPQLRPSSLASTDILS